MPESNVASLAEQPTHCLMCTQVNLSCNFFRGSFDESKYVEFIGDYFADCDARGAL